METKPRWNLMKAGCPTREVLVRVADKWTMLVITSLSDAGPDGLRFSELRRRIEGVSQKMLTQTLRALERDGLIDRTVHPTVPVTVEYRLTPLGESLAEAITTIRSWAYANMDAIDAARAEYDAAAHPAVASLNRA
jgi:DNA-binding HxlR family transcriptional regulator